MKTLSNEIALLLAKTGSQKVRVVLFVLTIVLFVLGSGAPEAGGGTIFKVASIRF